MRLGPGRTTSMVRTLLIINGMVFVVQLLMGPSLGLVLGQGSRGELVLHTFGEYFSLVPANVVTRGFLWQLVTYQFLHGGFFHLLINMFVLWMFGVELERKWGATGFLRFYLTCGVVAGLGMVIFSYGRVPVVGASGAIFGLLGAFALNWPDRRVYVWGIFPMKIKHFVFLIGFFTLTAGMSETQTGVAHLAHLFGLLMGLLYCWKGNPRRPLLGFITGLFSSVVGVGRSKKDRVSQKKSEWKSRREELKREQILKEADEILDKLNRRGWENLTAEEQRKIKEISEKLTDD